MADTYGLNLPEFEPLKTHFAGAVQLYQAAKRASADEARKDWELTHKQAEEARAQKEFEHRQAMDTRTLDIDNSKQLLPGSDTFRAAAMSTALGNQVGKPYGISFDEQTQHTPAADNATPSSAEAAKFLQSGGVPKSADAELLNYKAPEMAPETSPDLPPERTGSAPPIDADTLAANNEAQLPSTKHVYATSRGQRFEVPPQGPTALYNEAEYNALVDKLVASGHYTEPEAIKVADARRRTDVGEGGKNRRFDASLGQKQATQLTTEEQQARDAARIDASRENSIGRDRAILGAAGIRASAGMGQGMPAMSKEQGIAMNALNQRVARIQSVSTWPKLIESEKSADLLLHDVENGSVPLQNREAQVLAAKIIRGRVTNEEMHQLYDNIGGASDYFSRLVSNTGLGELSDEQLNQLRVSTQVLLNQDREMRLRAQNATRLGLRSFGSVMPGQAQDAYEMMMAELGLPAEQLFADQGAAPGPAAAPARGVRPAAPPPAQKAAPAPVAAPPAGGDPIGTRRPDKQGHMREKTANGWVLVQ